MECFATIVRRPTPMQALAQVKSENEELFVFISVNADMDMQATVGMTVKVVLDENKEAVSWHPCRQPR